MRRRVVVTGIGMVNPLAIGVENVWNRLKNGESSVDYTTIFDASNFPTKISSEVKNFDVASLRSIRTQWSVRRRM